MQATTTNIMKNWKGTSLEKKSGWSWNKFQQETGYLRDYLYYYILVSQLKQPPIATLTSYVGFSKYIDRTEDGMEQAHHV